MFKSTYIIIKKNKDKGLEALYNRYGKKLYNYAIKNWKTDEDTAWELIYATFGKIISKIDSCDFENEKKFGSFVLLSFLNNLRNHYRDSKNKVQIVSGEDMQLLPNYEDTMEAEETESCQMKSLKEELAKLKDWERMLLLLKAQQMPYAEIAKYIDKPEEQLKVYYARLKKKITENITIKEEVDHA